MTLEENLVLPYLNRKNGMLTYKKPKRDKDNTTPIPQLKRLFRLTKGSSTAVSVSSLPSPLSFFSQQVKIH